MDILLVLTTHYFRPHPLPLSLPSSISLSLYDQITHIFFLSLMLCVHCYLLYANYTHTLDKFASSLVGCMKNVDLQICSDQSGTTRNPHWIRMPTCRFLAVVYIIFLVFMCVFVYIYAFGCVSVSVYCNEIRVCVNARKCKYVCLCV